MTLGTSHGRVTSRPGDLAVFDYLGSQVIATATAISIFFAQYSPQYTRFRLSYRRIEKPDGVVAPSLLVSTNGASFETAAAYGREFITWSATSALTATGLTGLTAIAWSNFSLVTASGKTAGECTVEFSTTATGGNLISFDWRFLNSASSPAHTIGSGFFATGPIAGLQLQLGGVSNFSGVVDIYGIKTPVGV